MSSEAKTIAQGGQPAWKGVFDHPEHGELEFRVEHLPKVRDWLAQSIAQEQIAPGLIGAPSLLAAAVAGLQTFVKVPVVREHREEDPDTPGRVTIHQERYDPLEDENIDFPIQVWLAFMEWRVKTLSDEVKEEAKNSSGATSGLKDDDSSPVDTTSPQTIPA